MPPGWARVALADVVRPSKEKIEPSETKPGTPYLSLEHIASDTGEIIEHGTSADVRSTKAVFRPGDVLYGKLRPYLNKVATPDFAGVCSTDIIVFPAAPAVLSPYLAFYLRTREVVEYANHNSNGVQLPRISFDKLGQLPFPLPPLAEQRQIVAKVEMVLVNVNATRARLAKVSTLLKRFRRSVYNAASSGQLTAQWKEARSDKWIDTTIGEITDCLDNIRRPVNKDARSARVGTIPYYGANGQVGWIDQHLFDEDLVLVVEDESFIGRTKPFSYVIRGKSWVNNHAHVLRPKDGMPVEYLNYCLAFYDFVPLTSGTTGRRKLNKGALMAAPIRVAPLSEQYEIARRVEALFALADKIEARVALASARADKLIQSTLAKAFRGELISTEHALVEAKGRTYEAAEQLLTRVQSVSAAVLTGKKRIKNDEPAILVVAAKSDATIGTTVAKKKHSKGIFFKRAAIASYAVERLHSKDTFGRIKLEKLLYLSETHVGIDLEGDYRREAAGPLDPDIYKIENLARKMNWFDSRKRDGFGIRYRPGAKISDRSGAAKTLLGPKSAEMDRLLTWFEQMNTEQAEVFATVFAAWNDLLIDGEKATDDQVIEQVREHWHKAKERFTPKRLRDCIGWIRKHNFVPRGAGPRTKLADSTPAPDKRRRRAA